jgi:hypothetical protein
MKEAEWYHSAAVKMSRPACISLSGIFAFTSFYGA